MPKNKTKAEVLIELKQAHTRIAELEAVGEIPRQSVEFHSVGIGITKQQTEEDQQGNDERYHLLFERMTQGVVFQDDEGRLLHANPAVEKIMGITLEKMRDQKAIDPNWPIVREDGSVLPADEHPTMRVLNSGQPVNNIVIRAFNPIKQTYIWLSVNAFPRFKDGDSRPYQVFTIFDDITVRKQAEEKLRESEKRLRSMLEISQAMSASLEMDTVLQKIVENAANLLELESGAIYTLEGDELFLEATTPPLPTEFPNELRHANVADHPHIQAAIKSGSSVVLADATSAELSSAEKVVAESRGLRSIIYIPLMISEKAIGVLIVATVNRLRTFSEEEIALYSGFSGQAAQSIENIRLYRSEREYAVELEMQISERQQVEEELRESERKYRDLINGMNETVWVIDMDMRFLDVNDAAVKTLGYSRDELLSMKVSDIDGAIEPEQIRHLIDRLQEEKLQVFETFHKAKDGRLIPVELSSSLVSYMGRTVIMSIARDITDRKQAEEVVRLAEQRSRALIENAPDGVVLIGMDGRFKYASPAVKKIFGYEQDEALEGDPNTLTHPDDLLTVIAELAALIEDPSRVPTLQYRFKHKNGEWRWIESVFSNLLMQPNVEAIVINFRDIHERRLAEEALIRDIAERKRVEEQLRAEQIRFAQVEATTPGAICTVKLSADGSFSVPYASQSFEDLFGIVLADVSKNVDAILEKIPPEQVAPLLEAVNESAANLTPWRNEFNYRHPSKGDIWLEGYSMPVQQNDGSMVWHGVITDITERKLAEDALRTNEERIRTVADFTYDMEFWMDENKTLQYMSPSCKRITGYERDQFLQDPSLLQRIVYSDDRLLFDQHNMEEFDLPDSSSLDFRIMTAAGEARWISHTCQAVTGADGKFRGRRVSHRDVTEQRRVLQELRASEEKYRGLLESLDSVIATVDSNGKFLYMNDKAAAQLGGETSQFVGKTMYELFPEQVAKKQMVDIQNVIETDLGKVFENLSFVNGLPRWYRTFIQPLHDEAGQVASVLVNSTDIHALKMMQQELQELNHTLEEKVTQRTAEVQDLYENAATGYHSIDADGNFVRVNQTELDWLGYTREDMIGHAAIDFMTVATRGVFYENFLLLIRRGWVKDVEYEFIRKNGSTLPVSLSATAIYDENGNFIMTRSTIFDNTERKQAETELKRNINFTSALLNAVPTPVFYKDKEGRYLGCNHSFSELMGKTSEEILGKLPNEVWETPQADLYRQKDLELMQANERQFYEAVITDKDGIIRPVIFVKDLFYDEDGNVAGLVGAFIDISERKQAEVAIRESEATYRALFENSNDGIFLMSSTGEELRANQRALDMLGYTLEEYLSLGRINQNPFALETEQRKDADDKLAALLRGETVPLYERIFTAKDRHKVPVEINLSPVRDANGKIIMVQSVVRDIGERKAAEEALRSINKELERALRVKDEFLANMSHELRTPLNSILGFSEMLLSGQFGSLSERQNKYISSIDSSGKHLLGLINDLLDLAKIEAGKLDVTLENVVISDLCQSSLMFVKQIALQKNIHLSFEQDMTFPYVVGDQRRLKQILVNLLSNAVKFTPNHGKVTLRVIADPAKDCINFAVEDTGIGISQADLLRLFKPFTQVDSSLARRHEGTGLGLALVQKLVELHGGGVFVQSEVGKGSTFTICIPGRYTGSSEEKNVHQITIEHGVSTVLGGTTGCKILLAEDMESNIVILGDYLEHQGYELIYARNGQEALEKARETQPDLILMDIQMPVMDGLVATRRLRADPRFATVPIIALTALAMTGDQERCLEAGATEYVSKPANLKKLKEMIANLIKVKA